MVGIVILLGCVYVMVGVLAVASLGDSRIIFCTLIKRYDWGIDKAERLELFFMVAAGVLWLPLLPLCLLGVGFFFACWLRQGCKLTWEFVTGPLRLEVLEWLSGRKTDV